MNVLIDHLSRFTQQLTGKNPAALDSGRIFHGRGQAFAGLEFVTIDFFHPVILITFYAEPSAEWFAQFQSQVVPACAAIAEAVVLQRRHLPKAPSEVLAGQLPDEVFAQRGAMRFNLHVAQQQNSGFFLDMEPGRQWLEQHAAGKRVLNLFAYTCAFSVVAIAAGAEKVVNVDMSSAALNLGRANHHLNNLEKAKSQYLAENILKSWSRVKKPGPYDLVIIDPPSYQKGSFIAEKDYAKVIRRLPELMPEGGLVLACLNSPELTEMFLRQQFNEQCPQAECVERLPPSPDFPDIDPDKQLKLLVYRLPSSELCESDE